MIHYTLAQESDLEAITQLLKINNLPHSDLRESQVDFIVATDMDRIIGCIGVEKYGHEGLLRSFAVEPGQQNKGIGRQLYKQLLAHAANNQITRLHLLTNTAKDYFSKVGFGLANRQDAPENISKSREFAGLCPVSSTYMRLDAIQEYAD